MVCVSESLRKVVKDVVSAMGNAYPANIPCCSSLVFCLVVAFAIVVYARDYMERYTSKDLFYTLLLLMLAGMNGVLIAGDLFNLFVFLEIAAEAGSLR